MPDNLTEELESMIDKHGLLHVITGLDLMCAEKREHILANWQDPMTAKPWGAAGRMLQTLARKIEALGI